MYRLKGYEIKERFLRGELTCENIVNYFLRRIKKFDPKIQAFITLFEEKALQKAFLLDQKRKEGKALGKLAAIPVAIKDIIHIKGEKTTCASKFLLNYKALFDATVVERIENEDAIILGKTNLDEFAMGSSNETSCFFPTYNPWNLQCSPGGSSGGSTAAVAARLLPLALGSDTGGSIRQPASLSGVVGLKPTYGRVSRYGLVGFAPSLDQIGPIASNCYDAGLLMEVIGAHCNHDSTSLNLPPEDFTSHPFSSLKGKKIGIPWHFIKNIKSETLKNFENAINTLKSMGAETIEINLNILKYSVAIYYILCTAEASTNLARFDGIKFGSRTKRYTNIDELYDLSRDEGFGPEVKRRIMLGTYVLSSGYQEAYYKKAQKVRTLVKQAYEEAFQKCDFVAMPVAPSTAFKSNAIHDPIEMYFQDLFTIGANLAGIPAISINSGFDQSGLPFGLQLLASELKDANLIKAGLAFEQATGYCNRIPPLFDLEA